MARELGIERARGDGLGGRAHQFSHALRHDLRHPAQSLGRKGIAFVAVAQEEPGGDEERASLLQGQLEWRKPLLPQQQVTAALLHQRLSHL